MVIEVISDTWKCLTSVKTLGCLHVLVLVEAQIWARSFTIFQVWISMQTTDEEGLQCGESWAHTCPEPRTANDAE